MSDLRIGTLRLRGHGAGTSDVEPLLASIAPRREDRRVLVVRHLSLASCDPGEARGRVEDVRRRAAHPVGGPVSTDVEAVEFADEAEELLCLSRDVLDGTAGDRWWWAGRMPSGATATSATLATLWTRRARWVPTVLASLETAAPGSAARAVQQLGPACAGVLAAVLDEFPSRRGLLDTPAVSSPGPPRGPRAPRTSASTTVAQRDQSPSDPTTPTTVVRGAPWDPLGAASDAEPSSGPDPALVLLRLTEAVTGVDLVAPGPSTAVPAPLSPRDAMPVTSPNTAPDGIRPWPVPEVTEVTEVTAVAVDAAEAEASTQPLPRPVVGGPTSPTSLGGRSPAPPNAAGQLRRDPARPAWVGTGQVVDSQMATLLYSINLFRWFALDRKAGPRATGWGVVDAVGRWMLRRLPKARRRALKGDTLLEALADLDGRAEDMPPDVRLGHAMDPVRTWLDEHDVPPETFVRPGQVVVSRTHVDVVMSIEAVDLAARISGLDQDPGWVPELGRIVQFHFEGG